MEGAPKKFKYLAKNDKCKLREAEGVLSMSLAFGPWGGRCVLEA